MFNRIHKEADLVMHISSFLLGPNSSHEDTFLITEVNLTDTQQFPFLSLVNCIDHAVWVKVEFPILMLMHSAFEKHHNVFPSKIPGL